jgi:hypothetical protein
MSLVVGFRLIELASRRVRLDDFGLGWLPPLLNELNEGVLKRRFATSGADAEVFTAIPSEILGVRTGIGKSIDSLEGNPIGIGTLSDSLSGLMGHSCADPKD